MSETPLVTIAISCYNHANFIEKTILSALNQTYKNIELLMFDDGSKDDSIQIIESLQKKHGFFFAKQSNQGLSATLNQALEMAKGRYFAPFGSDDIMMLDKVEKQVNYLERNSDIAACGGNVLHINEEGRLYSKQKLNPEAIQDFQGFFFGKGPGLPAPTMFFRTDILKTSGGFNPEIPLEDLYIQLKLTSDGHKFGLLNDVLAYYRIHSNNTYKNLRYMLNNVLNTYSYFQDKEGYDEVRCNYLNSMLLKSASQDPTLAREILAMIPLRKYNTKTIKSLGRILTSYIKR